ncbi:hypothetical protein E2C01_034101 [Portunus trituberculatus]|uniref:Uncharacterized protein n=1 Tax=Portunus trituberculatus TaxID=210409 RepID=A0A5B7EZN1_PORTR|nr:hypothetical protein [Portunus trituberculatus]
MPNKPALPRGGADEGATSSSLHYSVLSFITAHQLTQRAPVAPSDAAAERIPGTNPRQTNRHTQLFPPRKLNLCAALD